MILNSLEIHMITHHVHIRTYLVFVVSDSLIIIFEMFVAIHNNVRVCIIITCEMMYSKPCQLKQFCLCTVKCDTEIIRLSQFNVMIGA